MSSAPQTDLGTLLTHAGWARSLAARLVRDAATADDLVQDALTAAVERPPAPDRPVRRWLAAVLRNLARQGRRAGGRRAAREAAVATPEALAGAGELAARLEAHRLLVEAVAALEEPYRGTVLLRYFEQLPPRAIARQQGVPVATVHTRLQRAHARLRATLDARHPGRREGWLAALLPLSAPSAKAGVLAATLLLMNAKLALAASLVVTTVVTLCVLTWGEGGLGAAPAGRPGTEPDLRGASVRESARTERVAESRREAVTPIAETGSRSAAASAPAWLPDARIPGRVLDVGGQPVPGVTVRMGDELQHVVKDAPAPVTPGPMETTTDAQGEFEFLATRTWGPMRVVSERWVTVLTGQLPSDRARRAVVVVAPRVAVAGTVVQAGELPVASAAVEYVLPRDLRARLREVLDDSGDESWSGSSDAQGRFRFAALPVVDGGELRATCAGFVPTAVPGPRADQTGLVITLRRESAPDGAILGTVLDAAGQPAARAAVSWGREATMSDDAGQFHLLAPAGTKVTVTAVRAGSLPGSAVVAVPASGPPPAPLVLRLGGAPLAITGRVLDGKGQPRANVPVWVDPTWFGLHEGSMLPTESMAARGGWSSQVQTDAEGRFTVAHLLARDYVVHALDPSTLQVVRREAVAAGSSNLELVLTPAGLVARIGGRVVDRRGAPVAGAAIGVSREAWILQCPPVSGMTGSMSNSASGPATQSDANGRFELHNVAVTDVMLSADGPEIMPASLRLADRSDLEQLELTVSRRCHFKVELREPGEADGVQLLDAAGRTLPLTVRRGNTSNLSDRVPLVAGRSETGSVEETACTLVLVRGKVEVRRVAIALQPGAPTLLQP